MNNKTAHIILGDIHIGRSLSIGKPASLGNLNSRLQDQINLLEWTLERAIEYNARSIITTGDVFEEPRPHPALIKFFMSWLKKCEKHGIIVHVIAGNHDIIRTGSYTISALDIIPAVELTSAYTYKRVFTVNYHGVSFTFLPYRDRRMYDADSPAVALEKLKEELGELPSIPKGNKRVLVGHLTLEGSIYIGDEIDDMLNEIVCPLDMFNDYDYVWMGHIHKHQVLKEKPYIAHTGSMDRSDFHVGEISGEKYLILFDPASDEPVKNIVIPTRPLRKIEISVPADKDTTDFIINTLFSYDKENSLKDAIIKLEIELVGPDSPNADRDKVTKFIYNNLNAHYITTFSESRNISVISVNTQLLFDSNISKSAAIKAYADTLSVDEEKRNKFTNLALEYLAEYEEKS